MTPLLSIRRSVFGITQAEMAGVAGVSQGTISKWEAGTLEPSRIEMGRIRDAAAARSKAWDDQWFFIGAPVIGDTDVAQPERAA